MWNSLDNDPILMLAGEPVLLFQFYAGFDGQNWYLTTVNNQ
jgi:hypothetical protein